jgi:hypothetical protein
MQEYKGTSADLASQVLQKTEQNEPENVGKSVERKIIKEGQLSFETAKVSETKNLIVSAVQELNGYISKDNVNDYSDRLEHRLVIRIPSEKFDLLLNKVSESAEKLDSKNIDVIDVTEEYIDIDTRIKTKKELENRYKELLKQATKIDEILSIERELAQLRSDIESVEGRMNYLKDRISYSTLTVTYYQKTASAFRFTSQFGQALKQGWSSFLWFLIGLTHLWTFILIAGVTGAYFFFRYKRNKNKKVR